MWRARRPGSEGPGLAGASCACSCAPLLCSAAAEGAARGLVSCPGTGLILGPGEGRGGAGLEWKPVWERESWRVLAGAGKRVGEWVVREQWGVGYKPPAFCPRACCVGFWSLFVMLCSDCGRAFIAATSRVLL